MIPDTRHNVVPFSRAHGVLFSPLLYTSVVQGLDVVAILLCPYVISDASLRILPINPKALFLLSAKLCIDSLSEFESLWPSKFEAM
jgi:hypothetical protein